jgi:DNA invertase Pin-like site-specific DNA recombinase
VALFDDDAMTLTWRCRPELLRAIRRCQEAGATLLIAKLDRLSRDPIVTSALKLAGVRFLACDNPTANELTIDILAAVAKEEARAISERTKAALAAKVARGERSAGRVPFGYRLADGGRLVADPTEQAALAAIPGMAALGWSARRIADLLRADHGVAITHRTVGRILAAGPRRAASAGAQ